MHTVEIEATRVHQTPSSLVEWCADTAGCKQCVLPKCTHGGKYGLSLQARHLESYLIFMGNDTAGPQGNGTIWSMQLWPFIPSLTKPADLNVKYTKSCPMCLDSSAETLGICWYVFLVCGNSWLKMNFSPWLYKGRTPFDTHALILDRTVSLHAFTKVEQESISVI